MKPSQHLHNAIGNCVGECKKRLFDRLTAGAEVDESLAIFIRELRVELELITLGSDLKEHKLKVEEPDTIG